MACDDDRIIQLSEGKVTKGGHNPPNFSTIRPQAPHGSNGKLTQQGRCLGTESSVMNQLSAIARSPEFKKFSKLVIKNLDLNSADPIQLGVAANVTGWDINNQNPPVKRIDGKENNEMLLTFKTKSGISTVNLANLLLLAAAYTDMQYKKISKSIKKRHKKKHDK